MRGDAEGTDRGDEGRNCKSTATDGFWRSRRATAGGKKRKNNVSDIEYPVFEMIKHDYSLSLRKSAFFINHYKSASNRIFSRQWTTLPQSTV